MMCFIRLTWNILGDPGLRKEHDNIQIKHKMLVADDRSRRKKKRYLRQLIFNEKENTQEVQ